jgi:hypothetical protein
MRRAFSFGGATDSLLQPLNPVLADHPLVGEARMAPSSLIHLCRVGSFESCFLSMM